MKKFLIIGGDDRQKFTAEYLSERNYTVDFYNSDIKTDIGSYDCVVLPLPVTKDGVNVTSLVPLKESLDEIIACIKPGQIVFGGMVGKGLENKIKNNKAKIFDYFKRDEVTIMNTVPTAQGILKIILENIDYTIDKSKCAVFGYGKVGKYTSYMLSSLGADVTVCARSFGDIALAETKKLNACFINEFNLISDRFDIVINTVPALVIDRKILSNLNKRCLIIDVSSAPFGTDFTAAYELGIKALQCSSLPGKAAPRTAGKIIAEGICNILKEEFNE